MQGVHSYTCNCGPRYYGSNCETGRFGAQLLYFLYIIIFRMSILNCCFGKIDVLLGPSKYFYKSVFKLVIIFSIKDDRNQ